MLRRNLLKWLFIMEVVACGKHTQKSSSSILHWQDGAQIALQFNSSVPAQLQSPIKDAVAKQNEPLKKTQIYMVTSQFQSSQAKLNASTVSGDGINGIYFTDLPLEATESSQQPDAITYTVSVDGRIVECDLIFKKDAILSASDQDNTLEALALHELGHALGLNHSNDSKSIMYEIVSPSILSSPFSNEYYTELRKRYELRL